VTAGAKILLIDDEPLIRHVFAAILCADGHEVVEAGDGAEGLRAFRSERPDLVVTDLRMPVLDGFAVLEAVKGESPATPLVVVSAVGSAGEAISAIRHGAWDYVTKPLREAGELSGTVKRTLTRARALAEDKAYHDELERRLTRQAYYDDLTGLPNRRHLTETLALLSADAPPGREGVAVLLIDLDNFKHINDTLGHRQGDELLRLVSARLRGAVHPDDTVGRFMGDEFVVLSALRAAGDAERLAGRVMDALRSPFAVGHTELFVTPSIGIAVSPEAGDTAAKLLKNAEAAMYASRKGGAGGCRRYTRGLNAEADIRLTMATRLHKALDRGEFALHYQPQFDLATRAVTGMEALLRWNPRDGMSFPPSSFVPVLEEAGLIVPVGEWVIREACRQQREWLDAGSPQLALSVNVSAWQFHGGRLADTVRGALDDFRLDPRSVCLELTESIVMHDAEETIRQLRALTDLGVNLSIDDFGTGYSSLSYLRRMPIHELKIDRSFVANLPHDGNCAAIVNTILGMAGGLNLSVVAEGVETEAQRDFLAANKCATGQGFLYSRPLPPDAFSDFVRATPPETL
jgi:diguanylate cyclase (GGDEF)-like protein